jgi:hypothetical protein
MFKQLMFASLFAAAPLVAAEAPAKASGEALTPQAIVAAYWASTLGGDSARAMVAGTKTLAVDVRVLYKPQPGQDFVSSDKLPAELGNLEADVRLTDVLGSLQAEGFKVLSDENKASNFLSVRVLTLPANGSKDLQYMTIISFVQKIRNGATYKDVPVMVWSKPIGLVPGVGGGTAGHAQVRQAVRKGLADFVAAARGK